MNTSEFRVFMWAVFLATVTVACLPLVPLAGYPMLLFVGGRSLARWAILDEGLEHGLIAVVHRKNIYAVSLWVVSLGFVMMIHGIFICMDSPMKGAPPTEGEKAVGRMLAYSGAALALPASFLAYFSGLPSRGSAEKPTTAELERELM